MTLPEIAGNLRSRIIQKSGLELALYLRCTGKEQEQSLNDFSYDDEKIAFAGYANLPIEKEQLTNLLSEKHVKGIGFRANIYKLVGVNLKALDYGLQDIDATFPNLEYKFRFIISKLIFNNYDRLIKSLQTENSQDDIYIHLLSYLFLEKFELNPEVLSSFLEKDNLDAIDLVILEKIMQKMYAIKYIDINSIDLVLKILESFSNSIKRITSDRYNNRQGIIINDEYDVQDTSFSLLKGVFSDLQRENPMPKQAGVSSRIDMNIPSEGIMIEIKMIKSTDKDHRKYIKELKEDIVNYSVWDKLRHLVLFVYDPYNRTTDDSDFDDLENVLKDSRTFSIHSILVK